MKKSKRKRPAQVLGLTRIPLTPKSCRARAKALRLKVEKGEFRGETAKLARRWANWYASKGRQLAA